MALHVLDEANRCLGCKKPMCQQGCPIHTNIPEVIRLLKANELDAAGRMLFENNPLTTVCSLVCNHENQCEGHCIRNRMPSHDPVHFSIIEDYISTTYANKMTKGPAPRNGMKAAVVGAGPAGLTIAVLLARWGYDITIFDARDKIGGVMRYGIPNYRLPDSVLDDFQYRHLELKGIHVRPNTTIGKTITIDDLFRDGYKSVRLACSSVQANAICQQRGLRQMANQGLPAGGRHRRDRRGNGHGLRPHRHPQRCPPWCMPAGTASAPPEVHCRSRAGARWGYDITIFDARDVIGGQGDADHHRHPQLPPARQRAGRFAQYRHLELKGIHVRRSP